MYFVGSKSFTSPAICDSYGLGSNRVIRAMPPRPCIIESHVASTVSPIGVTAPIPVTTMRLIS